MAQEPVFQPRYENSYALLIGIDSYADPRFATLGNAEADAASLAALLAEPPFSFAVTTLTGSQATRHTILQALFALRSTGPNDRVLVYFAGHGYTLVDRLRNETGYLAAFDTIPEQDYTALELSEVTDLRLHAEAKHIAFIFDACFSGQALGLSRGGVAADRLMERRAYQVITAGAGDQTVSDLRSMTGLMVEALRSGAAGVGGMITLNALGHYIQQIITADSRSMQIPQYGPLVGSQGGDFVFRQATGPRLPTDVDRSLSSSRAYIRQGAVVGLIELARGDDPELASMARLQLERIRQADPDEAVRAAAQRYFDGGEAGTPIERPAQPLVLPSPIIQPPAEPAVAAQRPIRKKRAALGRTELTVLGVMGVAMLVVAAIGVAVILSGGGLHLGASPDPTRPPVQPASEAPAGSAPTDPPTDSQAGVATLDPGVTATADDAVVTTEPPPVETAAPQVGPGGRIAFSSGSDRLDIYVMSLDGSAPVNLTNGSAGDAVAPSWSPDGSQIAFASNRDGGRDIFIMNADGSNVVNLTNSGEDEYTPAWSPDGGRIAFRLFRSQNDDIYVINTDGSGLTNLTNSPGIYENSPTWSPDGSRIAYTSDLEGNRDIFVMNADGSGQTNLTHSPDKEFNPVWSPTGARIAFDSARDGDQDVFAMNADGSDVRNLTNFRNTADYAPSWSPDGLHIAFVRGADLYLMNADGSGQGPLPNPGGDVATFAWGP